MKRNKNNCDLNTCLMCRLSVKEWKPAIEAARKNFEYNKGEQIFTEGEQVAGIYFIYKGVVKIHRNWGEDKTLIFRFAKEGDIIGHRGLGQEAAYPVTATAMTPVTVCFVSLEFFLASVKVNHEMAYQLLMFFAEELQESEKKMRNLAHMQVKGRVAYSLLLLEEKFGKTPDGEIALSLSRSSLAAYVGTTYETLFRIVNEFIEEGILKLMEKKFTILNRQTLEHYTHETD